MLLGRTDERPEDRGAVALLVAMLTVVLAGLAALVVDLGLARDEQRIAQNAADAAVLAAAQRFADALNPDAVSADDTTAAQQKASDYARTNGWPAGIARFQVDPVGETVTIALTPVRTVRIFAGALGENGPTVGASATATWGGAAAPCSICVLGSLTSRNGQVVASTGSILVGGSLDLRPSGSVTAGGIIGVVGAVGASGTVTPPATPIPRVTDPYQTVPVLPPAPPAPALGATPVTASGPDCDPGTYSDVTACRTFRTGVYIVTGTNSFSGGVRIDAGAGVLFYLTCTRTVPGGAVVSAGCAARGQAGGSLDFAGTVDSTISALPDPTYRGLAIVYDRANTSPLTLLGGPDLVVNGGVYARSAALANSGSGPAIVNGTLVVGSVTLNGNPSSLTVNGSAATAPRTSTLIHLTR